MIRRVVAIALVASALAASLHFVARATQSSITAFDDSAPDRIVLAAPDYRLTFSKSNGALLGIADPGGSAEISRGSSGGCLWGSILSGPPGYIGGCSFGSGGSGTFSYLWEAASSTLNLHYSSAAAAGPRVNADVVVTAGSGPSFDMQLTLANRSGSVLRDAIFPSHLLFDARAVRDGYLPYYLPGVRVKRGFFTGDHQNVPTYPGGNAFADFLALDIAGTHFALYSVNKDPAPVQPVALGFVHGALGSQCLAESFCIEHTFQTWVPNNHSWTSPIVRILIGQSISAAVLSYRQDNGINGYPSVAAKLGHRFRTYGRSPLIKADTAAVDKPFLAWIPGLSGLPSPSLLHAVGYMRGGHDHSYPDFLPPDPTWGTEKDFAALVRAAHSRGLLMMPYTNPMWWVDDSRTVNHLPAGVSVADISVLDEGKSPVRETYGQTGGYDASPYAPFVQTRLAEDMSAWQSAVPVDCVFEDQIGARPWMPDLNPASPSPTSYSQGWLEHTRRYAQQCLMTENGWDRLASTEAGFDGSLLTWERVSADPDQFFGAGAWEPYPLALWLFHDKVLLYQHNLSLDTMSNRPGVLTWNLAFGFMLSYNWDGSGRNWQSNAWLDLITWLQRDIGSLFAGQRLQTYHTIAPQVTRTTFPTVQVVANWNARTPYTMDGTQIAPGGFLAESSGDSTLAGEFTGQLNHRPLSSGTHYIIVTRTHSSVIVRQPIGARTLLYVGMPGRPDGSTARVAACDRQSHCLGIGPVRIRGGGLLFEYDQTVAHRPVAYYEIT